MKENRTCLCPIFWDITRSTAQPKISLQSCWTTVPLNRRGNKRSNACSLIRLPHFMSIWVQCYYISDFCRKSPKTGQMKARYTLQLLDLLNRMVSLGMSDANSVKLIVLKVHPYHAGLIMSSIMLHFIQVNSVLTSADGRVFLNGTLESKSKRTKIGFAYFQTKDLAIQMCLLESKMFRSIDRSEFFDKGWTRDSKATTAPNITAMIKRSNHVAHRD